MTHQTPTCPNCGSDNVSKPSYSRKAFAISFLLLGFPLPFLSKERHCFECGLDFKVDRSGQPKQEEADN
ncbi:hypothetical protein [Halocola ammonii]